MIAIAAAVPFETALLRRALEEATELECGPWRLLQGRIADRPVRLLHCGVGKSNTAAALAALFTLRRPSALLMVGCGGAFPSSGLTVGELALADAEIYGDEGVLAPGGFLDMEQIGFPLVRSGEEIRHNRFSVDPQLLEAARRALPGAGVGPFVTVSTCSGTAELAAEMEARTGGICENMEGAAAAHLCTLFDLPFLELRGISNLTVDRDLSRWDLKGASAAAQQALLTLLGSAEFEKEAPWIAP